MNDIKDIKDTAYGRDSLRSQSLDLLRFPLAVVVISVHVIYSEDIRIAFGDTPILNAFLRLLGGLIIDQSVPVYFFISGFVFFLNITLTKGIYIRKLKNRVKSLLIPYIIWNSAVIAKFLVFALPAMAFMFTNPITLSDLDISANSILMSFWDDTKGITHSQPSDTNEIYPINGPLWFIRDLMIVVLFCPVIYKIMKWKRMNVIAICGIGLLWFISCFEKPGHAEQLLTAFLFFSCGAYFSIKNKDMLSVFGRYFKFALFAYSIFSLAYAFTMTDNPEMASCMKKFNQFAGLVVAYNISALLIEKKKLRVNKFLSSSSFFIYSSNWIIMYNVESIISKLIRPESGISVFVIDIITIVVTVSLLLTVFYVLRRYSPKLLKVIAGRK